MFGFIEKIKYMRIRGKMIIVFIIGGVIPLVFSVIYTNYQSREMLIKTSINNHTEEIGIVGSSITENVTVLMNVIRSICYDRKIAHMATRDYSYKTNDFLEDAGSLSIVDTLRNYYRQSVADVTIYLDNKTIPLDTYDRTNNFQYLDSQTKSKDWYKKTVSTTQAENWFFGEEVKSYNSIQVSRAIYGEGNNVVGVVMVTMEDVHLINVLKNINMDVMVCCGKSIVYSNFLDKGQYDFAMEKVDFKEGNTDTKYINQGKDRYLMFLKRIDSPSDENIYQLISLQKYNDMLSSVNSMTLKSMIPSAIGVVVSIVLIVVFAFAFERRIDGLSSRMKLIAKGYYDKVKPMQGDDEISRIYAEILHMAEEMQQLMETVMDEKVQKEKIHTKQKEVEFKMLASQINPHFLYNTLETIRMKAVVNKQPEIVELVKMLAKIMRYNIQVSDSKVSLQSELDMNQYYLKIQSYRFGDRITSEIIVDDDVDTHASVMPLIVQPFVENAFRHGLEAKESDAHLTIHARMENENIVIDIVDNGVGMNYLDLGNVRNIMNSPDVEPTHIGVANVNQRIKMAYGDQYGVTIESEEGKGTSVHITFPYERE